MQVPRDPIHSGECILFLAELFKCHTIKPRKCHLQQANRILQLIEADHSKCLPNQQNARHTACCHHLSLSLLLLIIQTVPYLIEQKCHTIKPRKCHLQQANRILQLIEADHSKCLPNQITTHHTLVAIGLQLLLLAYFIGQGEIANSLLRGCNCKDGLKKE